MDRRSFIQQAGVATVLVAGGGVWRAAAQGVFSTGEGPAYAPWHTWRTDNPILGAAILAASPHNTQPWLFRVADSWIEVYADTKRNTGALDPFLREAHIGLGCAIENIALAAGANGFAPSVLLYPGTLGPIPVDQTPDLVARVTLSPSVPQPSPLYDAIPHRHTNRSPYDVTRPLPASVFDGLRREAASAPDVNVFLFTDPAVRTRIVDLVLAADHVVYADPAVLHDTHPWVRWSAQAIQRQPDGLTIDCAGQTPAIRALRKFLPGNVVIPSPPWTSYRSCLTATTLFGIIAVRDRYDRESSLRAGRLWQRLHLWATANGIAARPMNEAIELVDHEQRQGRPPQADARLAELTGDPTWQPTFMFRMGYAVSPAPASPRRPVGDVLLP
jgi:nitroreductase